MARIKYCAGNWKLNKNPEDTKKFIQELNKIFNDSALTNKNEQDLGDAFGKNQLSRDLKIIIFPPAYNLSAFKEAIDALPANSVLKSVGFGPQNIHSASTGAFTGEISPAVVKQMGAEFALIGHSERRTLFAETSQMCTDKVSAALASGLVPMLCVGETLAERESNRAEAVVREQLKIGLSKVEAVKNKIVVAYEPVWAIGTGKVATPEQAEEMHKFIRDTLQELFGAEVAASTSVLYGGSVKPDNVAGLTAKPNIDGFLVGGASLNPSDFSSLIKGTY